VLVSEPDQLLAAVSPVPGRTLTFETHGIGQPRDVTLVPLASAADIRYNVYWTRYTPGEWTTRRAAIEAAEARRREVAATTVDAVDPGSDESEAVHGLEQAGSTAPFFGTRRGREATGGWFSYRMKVVPARRLALVCTYRGGEGRRRVFDILVDGEKIATENLPYHPTEFLDYEYALPAALTAGKSAVTVRFQSQADGSTAAVFDVRIVPSRQQ